MVEEEKAEKNICSLMAKLQVKNPTSQGAYGDTTSLKSGGFSNPWPDATKENVSPSHRRGNRPVPPMLRAVVEEGDTKDYLGKLRPENHLVPIKSYESMNYRELILGMAGVHAHLQQHNRVTYGYEQHCLFVKRKSVSFLYANSASVLYDRQVTDKVISGEFSDYRVAMPL